jgi:hypothetical protein
MHELILLDDAILRNDNFPSIFRSGTLQQIQYARAPFSRHICYRAHLMQAVADLLVELTKRIHLVHGDCAGCGTAVLKSA